MKLEPQDNSGMSRRSMVSLLIAGMATATGACAPARILWHLYPEDFDTSPGLVDKILRAFVVTVVPGVDPEHPNLVRAFYDDFYPLRPHRNFIAAELCSRSGRVCGTDSFETLDYEDRERVVQSAMESDTTTVKLFTGAIMLAQVSCYGGIYDAEHGCDLIDFHGTYRLRGLADTTYPDPQRFLATPQTPSGHPA